MGGYPLWEGALEVLLYTTSNLQIQGTLSDLILIFWQWSEQVAKYYQLCVIISHVVYVDLSLLGDNDLLPGVSTAESGTSLHSQ